MYAILINMNSNSISIIGDVVIMVLIPLLIGLLFTWWAGAAVFLLGLAVVLRGKAKRTSSLSHNEPVTSDEESEWYYYCYGLHHRDIRKD